MCPQRGTGYEDVPPNPTYVGQCNDVSIPPAQIPGARNEGEDFGGDPVDWGERVLQGPNQAEDFESVPLENIDLEHDMNQPLSVQYVFRWSDLSLVEGSAGNAVSVI